MRLFLLNILLALLWMLMWGQFQMYTMIAGFMLGYLLLGVVTRITADRDQEYGIRGIRMISFIAYFIRILIKANLIVAKEIITPGFQMTPRFIRYDVRGLTPFQLTSLANAITLTPGTLSVDLGDDHRYLYIHCMYAENTAHAVSEIDELRDRLLKEFFGCTV